MNNQLHFETKTGLHLHHCNSLHGFLGDEFRMVENCARILRPNHNSFVAATPFIIPDFHRTKTLLQHSENQKGRLSSFCNVFVFQSLPVFYW